MSLESLDSSAKLLTRYDSKYIVNLGDLPRILEPLCSEFAVLRIGNEQVFRYRSCYFDDNFRCYHDHRARARPRFKVRTRLYVDSADMFFEVKIHDRFGRTAKERIPCGPGPLDQVAGEPLQFLGRCLEKHGMALPSLQLRPTIVISYQRVTLIALRGGERMTIDFGVKFSATSGIHVASLDQECVVIETKSKYRDGLSDWVLAQLGCEEVKSFSKYCEGVELAGPGRAKL